MRAGSGLGWLVCYNKHMNNKTTLRVCSWGLGLFVVALATVVWAGERLDGGSLTTYDVFPLLGLAAFSLMWTHYVLGSLRRLLGVSAKENKLYSAISSYLVLAFILLHPGLLIFQLYKDGFGLPPQSYLEVYGAMKFAIGLGSISLLIFLLFELKRRFQKKSWWKYIDWAQVVAMTMIFYHGLSLGRELSVSWYKAVWYAYGVSLIAAVVYNYWYDKRGMKEQV